MSRLLGEEEDEGSSHRHNDDDGGIDIPLLQAVAPEPVDQRLMTAQCGTPQWMAPELCQVALGAKQRFRLIPDHSEVGEAERRRALESFHRYQDDHKRVEYSQKVDVYAYAITMYEVTAHQPPWESTEDDKGQGGLRESMTPDEVYQRVVANERPELDRGVRAEAPEGWCRLMEQCWAADPTKRPSFNVILRELAKISSPEEHYEINVTAHRWPAPEVGPNTGRHYVPPEPRLQSSQQ